MDKILVAQGVTTPCQEDNRLVPFGTSAAAAAAAASAVATNSPVVLCMDVGTALVQVQGSAPGQSGAGQALADYVGLTLSTTNTLIQLKFLMVIH